MAVNEKVLGVNQQVREDEIDLLEIAYLLWTKIWLILAGFVVGAVIAFIFSRYFITPLYKADSIIYIFSKTTSITSLADLQIGSQLTGDFTIIATTREVIESVIDDLQLDMTHEQLTQNISVTNPSSSHMLLISVKDPDPVKAANICNTLSDKLREQISDIMNTDRPSVVQRAVVPEKKDSPSVVRNTGVGALIGVMLAAGIIIIWHLLDDTIKTDEDVKKHLGVDVLAAFPYVRGFDSKHDKDGGKSRSAPKKPKGSEPSTKASSKSSIREQQASSESKEQRPSQPKKPKTSNSKVREAVKDLEEQSKLIERTEE